MICTHNVIAGRFTVSDRYLGYCGLCGMWIINSTKYELRREVKR